MNTVPTITPRDQCLTIQAASLWLRARGIRPDSRHAIYAALARGELPGREISPGRWYIRLRDLERYAAKHTRPAECKTAVSA
ncbi:MAG TPA: hypothetical protein VFN76_09930 [Candidatus Limnocylindria bacterium]|nr:hypothetical protein [Candidatus Limnocylindria bacterium]